MTTRFLTPLTISISVLTAATATDAAFGKSKRGFMLIPQPYTVKSPVFDGASVGEEQQTAERAHVEVIQVKDTPWVRIRFGRHKDFLF